MSTFNMAIYTPEGEAFSGAVESLDAPGRYGRFGVLAHHAPMIIALKRGILKANTEGKTTFLVTGEGVLEVSNGDVTVLADTAGVAENQHQAEILLAS